MRNVVYEGVTWPSRFNLLDLCVSIHVRREHPSRFGLISLTVRFRVSALAITLGSDVPDVSAAQQSSA